MQRQASERRRHRRKRWRHVECGRREKVIFEISLRFSDFETYAFSLDDGARDGEMLNWNTYHLLNVTKIKARDSREEAKSNQDCFLVPTVSAMD